MRHGLIAAMAFLSAPALSAEGPVVAELFTSQGCSSCPPAEAYFRELAARPGVLALQWHVDYWDTLRTSTGAWKDPYSKPAHTARQRAYNVRFSGRASAYTPQAVIMGALETVGSDRSEIERFLARAPKPAEGARIAFNADGSQAAVTAPAAAEALLVTFLNGATTRVASGENAGRTLAAAHIVTSAVPLERGANRLPARADGEGCAVLIQEPKTGAILRAAYCP